MALGWIGKTLEQVRDVLARELEESSGELLPAAKDLKT